jgi:vacuolar-type H+-ATPase subunit F/Vma7
MFEIMMIVGPEMATGFCLAGVRVHEATANEDVSSGLNFALDNKNKIGLVVIDEALLEVVSERLRHRCEESSIPLILPLPLGGGGDPTQQAAAVQEMVRSAIGFTVKLD